MSSLYRRLRTIFNTPKTTSTATIPPSTVNTKERKLQKLVQRYKRSSESPEFRARHRFYSTIVRRLSFAKQFSMVEDFLEHQKNFADITNEQFTIRLISLYGKAGMLDHAHRLFDEMPDLKCTRTVRSFNALLSACIDSGKFDKVQGFLRDFPVKLGITPDVVSFNIVIKGYCEIGNLDSGVLVLCEMEKRGIEPDLITFNTLLNGFYGNGRFVDGEKIWTLMESKNVVPNVRSYNSRLRGLELENRVMEAVELLGEMENKGIRPDVMSYNAVIKGLCNDENVEEVKNWYRKLKENGRMPDRVTYMTLIPYLRQKGDLDGAVELCIEIMNKGLLVNATLFQHVVDELVKLSRVEEAKDLVERGKSNKHSYKLSLPLDK
ncbi:pentatricopeptide repeat-containing protein, putative [Ricinus communis]|uniref:Pentatricopeptide repeat-containing protein, putative n=1 Tax=Ricinus communis TaxID=3988 RepID=B9RXW5_RICCO|nr:pentatricopeptide repeat-containing protein, putative [Ricinus communis]|eukprot:XP_002518584.1 pentatricopeptide repeat-containing protein At3g13150 [Ricinus communis]